jgi:long-chain acyl-CoA synthetase
MDFGSVPNLVALFVGACDRMGDKPFLSSKQGDRWVSQSWNEVREKVAALADALIARGIQPGDRVALVSENRPEWCIADLAIISAGAITVPVYVTNTVDDHLHILSSSGARAAIFSTAQIGERLLPAAIRSNLDFVVAIEPAPKPVQGVHLIGWDEMLAAGRAAPVPGPKPWESLTRDDLVCLTYTSGTGGAPRGVMLTHGNILHNCMGAQILLSLTGETDEIFLSFLPLSHSYEHCAGQFFPIYVGAQIYYCEGADKLMNNLVEVRPTIVTLVPRLYEVMYQRVQAGLKRNSKFQQRLFDMALSIGIKRYEAPKTLTIAERLIDPVLDKLVRDKVRARFGGRLLALVSGGAALNYKIGLFFHALGLPVYQGYGQTEAGPVISANVPGRPKLHTVGPPLAEVEVKIAEDGEILVRGDMVMKGYWRDPEATAAVIKDGWLHTGDIGKLDEDNYLIITDRKRDVIVLSGGDNVSPAKVEGLLSLEPEIAQAMAHGDKRPSLVAILVPDEDFIRAYARKAGVEPQLETLATDPDFRRAMSEVLDRVNARMSSIERIKGFLIARAPFSTDNAMLTPSMKVRRHVVRETYGAELEGLYGARGG